MKSWDQMSPLELRDSGKREAIPELIRRLSSGSNAERCQATTALNHYAQHYFEDVSAAIPEMLELAADSFYPARRHALQSIKVLSSALTDDHRRRLSALAASEDRDANRKLIGEILGSPNGEPPNRSDGGDAPRTETPTDPSTLRIGIGHLFATGSNLGRDAIFHIGGVRLSDGQAPEYDDWIVNPNRRITKRLYEKSRVTNARAESSAGWSERRSQITRFFDGLDVLFVFNLYQEREWFDRHVVRELNRRPVVVDLHEMARFFLPDRTLYDLDELIARAVPGDEWRKAEPRLPYALRGVTKLLKDVLAAVSAPPSGSDQAPFVLSILNHALDSSKHSDFSALCHAATSGPYWFSDELPSVQPAVSPSVTLPDVDYLVETIKSAPPAALRGGSSSDVQKKDEPPLTERRLRPDGVAEAFVHLEKLKSVERREKQLEYAAFVTQAIDSGGRFAIEAGTGTGKTIGYLVPAAEFIRLNPGHKAVIATATKNLQTQLLDKELGKLKVPNSLFRDTKAALLKGKSNYICLTALGEKYVEFFSENRSDHDDGERLAWLHFAILCLRCEGDIEMEGISVRFRQEYLALREDVNAQTSCTSDLCDHGLECVYPRVLEHAARADLVVTNHHKLGYIGAELTDQASICIIDEADQFPDNFRSSAQTELSQNELVFRYLNRLVLNSKKRRGFVQVALADFEKRRKNEQGDLALLDECIGICRRVVTATERIGAVSNAVNQTCWKVSGREVRWQKLQPTGAAAELEEALRELAHAIGEVQTSLENLKSLEHGDPFLKRRSRQIDRYVKLSKALHEKANELARDYDSADFVHIASATRGKRGPAWHLKKVPMNLAKALQESVYARFPVTIYTSATLYVDDSLNLFRQELSLSEPFDAEKRIESPFDFKRNVLGGVASAVRGFDYKAEPDKKAKWRSEIADAIVQLVAPLYGRSLVLLTNTEEMEALCELSRERLEDSDIEVLVQNAASPLEISTFRKVEYSVLFGVDRFWTGVDFPGPTLSQVIVVRMPNPHLGDPLVEHRKVHIRRFWDVYYEPIARLKLRQGFGRLIRNATDRGIFVSLDSRLANDSRYGRYVRELPVTLEHAEDVGWSGVALPTFTERGLKHLGLMTEYEERRGHMMPAGPEDDGAMPF